MQNKIIGSCMRLCKPVEEEIERLTAEIERLQKENERFADIGKMYSEIRAEVAIEVLKEFAEKLKESAHEITLGGEYWYRVVTTQSIDHYLRKMTEPVKIDHNSLCETETYMGE